MKNHEFPAMRWHPITGEMQVFHAAHDVPADWLTYHPASADGQKPAPKVKPNELPMTKEEIVAALESGGIKFKATQGVKALYELLDANLREHLAANKIDIPEGATVPALLSLIPKQ